MPRNTTKALNPRKFKWVVEFTVDATWVADGFELDNFRADEMIQNALPYAYSHEVRGKVLAAPRARAIKIVQGFEKKPPVRKRRKRRAAR